MYIHTVHVSSEYSIAGEDPYEVFENGVVSADGVVREHWFRKHSEDNSSLFVVITRRFVVGPRAPTLAGQNVLQLNEAEMFVLRACAI